MESFILHAYFINENLLNDSKVAESFQLEYIILVDIVQIVFLLDMQVPQKYLVLQIMSVKIEAWYTSDIRFVNKN